MRACRAQPKSHLNIKNVARQDALNASLYGMDRTQWNLSRRVQIYSDIYWYNGSFTLYRRPQIEACSYNTYHGLLQKSKWAILNSRGLERPQKQSRRNQLIRRRLIKTKKIDRPIQTGYDAWSGGRYQDRLLGPMAEMAFVQLVCLRLGVLYKFHRHTYIGRTSHLGKIQDGRPSLHTHIHARTHTRSHADINTSMHARTQTFTLARTHARTHADRHLCSI